jgi:hypothetical protein
VAGEGGKTEPILAWVVEVELDRIVVRGGR